MIKFLDLESINKKYINDISEMSKNIYSSGWYINGPYKQKFEKDFSNYVGTNFCIGTGNGLDALSIILKSYILLGRLKKGDEVLVQSNTFIATVLSILESGLTPILVEPDINNYMINPEKLAQKISKKTKAIILVHLYGQIANYSEIMSIANNANLTVFEDSAQAHGAEISFGKAGNLGEASAFSFYPGKNLGAFGDAGGITTNDEEVESMCRAISNYGSREKYKHEVNGLNSRLDELQAGILGIKLNDLDSQNLIRRKIASNYLKNIDNELIELPQLANKNINCKSHVWHLFVVKSKFRDKLQRHLKNKGIETIIHYPTSIAKQHCFSGLDFKISNTALRLHDQILSIPLHPSLTDKEVNEIIQCMNGFAL
jgi:dTDP-4-amino-4,6-dideoxygalactose transaminase